MARRESQKRSLKPAIVIFTEGITEKKYFEKLNQRYNSKITVKVSETRKQGVNLVQEAKRLLENKKSQVFSKIEAQNVYIIFDKDDLQIEDLEQAREMAADLGYQIGFSNEAFEIWLLFHFEKVIRNLTRQQLILRLSSFLNKKYDKTDDKSLEKILDNLNIALLNSNDVSAELIFDKNPYSNIGKIIKEIYDI